MKFDARFLGWAATFQGHAWSDEVVHDAQHMKEASAGGVAFESSHSLRGHLDSLVLQFYGVVVMFEIMLPACDWHAVNQFHT